MIQALQILPQTLTSNTDDINFTTIDLRTGSATCNGWLQYNNGSNNFTIIGGGVFEITFNANVTSATTGSVALALKSSGNDIEGTEVDIQVLILIGMGLETQDILLILDMSKRTYYKRRQIISKRMSISTTV